MSIHCDHVTCFEGNAGTGKTTCCAAMVKKVEGHFLPEYTETLDAELRQVLKCSFEHKTDDDESHVWRKAEKHRAALLTQKRSRPVLVDTSLVSVVAFGCARSKFNRGGNVSATIRTYQNLLSTGQILLPDKIVHLTVSEDVRQARLVKRGTCHPFLARTDVSRYLDNVRLEFFRRYLPRDCWVCVDTSAFSLTEATTRVADELEKLEPRQMTDAFTAWLSSFSY